MEKIDEYWDSREQAINPEWNRKRDKDWDKYQKNDKDWDKYRKEGKRFSGESRREHDKHHDRKRFEGEKYRGHADKGGHKNRKHRHS
ncbi:hypothetical protein [Neobacillus sp. 19]|uniref:hypothetical protein n=1 Tax=Neobacillus sp. 19 TaxID=3394458 RepID=UPI003BF6DA3F